MSRTIVVTVFAFVALLLVGCSSESSGNAASITPPDYVAQFVDNSTPHLLLDVRTPEEYAEGFIAGSVNIPLQELETRLSEIPHDMHIVVYCRSGNRATQAADLLIRNGYNNVYNMGGVSQWEEAGYSLTQTG